MDEGIDWYGWAVQFNDDGAVGAIGRMVDKCNKERAKDAREGGMCRAQRIE